MRELIIAEIRRLASDAGGKPPGKTSFEQKTGIAEGKWSGTFWARWSDALAEAGFPPNPWNGRLDSATLLYKIALLTRQLGRPPTYAEMQLQRRVDPTFPDTKTVQNHFQSKPELIAALRKLAATEQFADLLQMLPPEGQPARTSPDAVREGMVYLVKSGEHYKIGRSDELERRIRELRIALPDQMTLIHAIRTDDPPGIEAYWHRRFGSQRANGEWFKLSANDVRAFTRRTFQ